MNEKVVFMRPADDLVGSLRSLANSIESGEVPADRVTVVTDRIDVFTYGDEEQGEVILHVLYELERARLFLHGLISQAEEDLGA